MTLKYLMTARAAEQLTKTEGIHWKSWGQTSIAAACDGELSECSFAKFHPKKSFRSEYYLCVEIENAVGENETKSETLMFLDQKCASLSQTLSTQLETGNSVMNFESVSGGGIYFRKNVEHNIVARVFSVLFYLSVPFPIKIRCLCHRQKGVKKALP